MNTETGAIYTGPEIVEAVDRGEPVVAVSERVVRLVSAGRRAEERAARKRKGKRKMAEQSRRANRKG